MGLDGPRRAVEIPDRVNFDFLFDPSDTAVLNNFQLGYANCDGEDGEEEEEEEKT